ncbi:hypothetical protein CL632_02975 [bacterium]|nr:hypothetical protein [bacterium]
MNKYIWITIIVIIFILTLAWKQAPNEPPVERLPEQIADDILQDSPVIEEGEPVISESGNIKVTRPQPDNKVESPMLVKGEAKVFEGTFQMRLKDSDGSIIVEKFGTAKAEEVGEFGSFGELLLFDEVSTETGALELFSISAFDGSEQDLVSIPIKFN